MNDRIALMHKKYKITTYHFHSRFTEQFLGEQEPNTKGETMPVFDVNIVINGANELTHFEDKFVVVTQSPLKITSQKFHNLFSPN